MALISTQFVATIVALLFPMMVSFLVDAARILFLLSCLPPFLSVLQAPVLVVKEQVCIFSSFLSVPICLNNVAFHLYLSEFPINTHGKMESVRVFASSFTNNLFCQIWLLFFGL